MNRPSPTGARLRSSACSALALGALAALAACSDAPLDPQVFQQPADGRIWTAVAVPAAVPTLQSWLPYVGPAQSAALKDVRSLRSEAQGLRRAGDLESAREREERAARIASSSLTRMPPPEMLRRAVAALNAWCREVENDPQLAETPGLVESDRVVRLALVRTGELLTQGDTAAAVVELASAAARVRSHSPEAVAVEAIARAEARLLAVDSEEARRVVHLLVSARDALAIGNSPRAYWRAVYALQLAQTVVPTP